MFFKPKTLSITPTPTPSPPPPTPLQSRRDRSLRDSDDDESLAEFHEHTFQHFKRESILPPTNVSTSIPLILRLPIKVRCNIWRLCHFKHFQTLRLTCKEIADDIDNHLGVSAIIDEREHEFDIYYEDIAIRHATIVNLSSPRVIATLLAPHLLVELTIKGPISTANFSYFLQSCPNISNLALTFTKWNIKNKPEFFTKPCLKTLPKLKTLKITSHTKKDKDIAYVCLNVTNLCQDLMENNKNIVELHFTLSHKTPSNSLNQIICLVLMLVHKNSGTLQEFYLQARESCSITEGGDDDTGDGSSSPKVRRGTDTVNIKKNSVDPFATNSSSSSTSSSSSSTSLLKPTSSTLDFGENYLANCTWPKFPFLRTAMITLNSHWFVYAQELLMKADKIRHLKLEACDGILLNCWLSFEAIVQHCSNNLTIIKLHNVSYEDEKQNPLNLDFRIFKPCKCLKLLLLSGVQRENKYIPKAKNLTCLPKSLIEIELWWVTINTWQWFRLLRSWKNLESLTIAYATQSDKSFGWFIFVLRWLLVLKWTKVQMIVVTDFKIKFRNKRSGLKKLRKAVNADVLYQDKEETQLIVDRGHDRHSAHSIPSIESI